MLLIQELLKQGVIDKEKAVSIKHEVKSSGRAEEEIILENKIVSESFLFKLKSELLKIPFKDVRGEEISLKILEFIPEESARYYKMVPLSNEDGVLEIGMVYPENLKAVEAVRFLARQGNFKYRIFLISFSLFYDVSKLYRTFKKEVNKALEELETEIKGEETKKYFLDADIEKIVEEAPIIKMVAVFLRHAVVGNASDIHIEPLKDKLRVRFRLDGILHSSLFLPIKVHPAIVARIKILSNLKIDETRIPQDGRFSTKIAEKNIDFRVSTFPTIFGEKVVLRILDPTTGLKNFEELGLEKGNLDILKRIVKKPYGMILITGPTGSGKTTTLYAVLKTLNKEGVNVVTLEDPVEYHIEGISQSQIKEKIGYTFASGLRHILRQDPDVIMVGEIRDKESAELAVHAALTGHLVLSTIHTTNAIGVIPRLIDLGIDPFLIPSTLSGALSQRLARRLCPYCKEKITPSPKVRDIILKKIELLHPSVKKSLNIKKPLQIYKPKGCKKCMFTGYSGRIALFEILEMTEDLGNIILKEQDSTKIAFEARRQGMLSMEEDGIIKVLDGITSIEEVLRVAEEKSLS
ncbi:MAG: GspE/PulE family protein [Patescibacteria group bacterium]|nr:GspE/PulE family protein [Patescibacteria group bacterium]